MTLLRVSILTMDVGENTNTTTSNLLVHEVRNVHEIVSGTCFSQSGNVGLLLFHTRINLVEVVLPWQEYSSSA
eukprot:4893668-Prorocentrum_lima.AAC.1